MKKTKLIALALVASMCMFAACNKDTDSTEDTEESVTTEETTEVVEESETSEIIETTETTPEATATATPAPTATPTPADTVSLDEKIELCREAITAIHDAHPSDLMYMELWADSDSDYLRGTVYSPNAGSYETDCEYISFTEDLINVEPVAYTYDWVIRRSNEEIIHNSFVDGMDTLPDGHYAGIVRSITQDATMMEVIVGEVLGIGSSDYPIICNPVILWVPISSNATFNDGISFFYYTNEYGSGEAPRDYSNITESPYWALVTGSYSEEDVHSAYSRVTPYTHSVYGPCYGFNLENQRSAADQRTYGYTYDAGVSISIDIEDGTVVDWGVRTS